MDTVQFFLRDEKVPVDNRFVFVLLPFKNTVVFDKIIAPVARGLGLTCKKADDLFTTGTIMQDVANMIRRATLVIADLTGKNPNVFYELGLAHAFKKPVVLLTQSDEDVPSDLKPQRYYVYNIETSDGIRQFENTLDRILSYNLASGAIIEESTESVLIEYGKGNERRVSSEFLLNTEGSFSIWALVSAKHDDPLPKPRDIYIVSHTTSDGGRAVRREVEEGLEPDGEPIRKEVSFYPNAFSIRRVTPRTVDEAGTWVFWCGADGPTRLEIALHEKLPVGWHLFSVVWSKQARFLKFFIDSRHIGTKPFGLWPEETSGQLFVGTWPTCAELHWFDSSIGPWRIWQTAIDSEQLDRYFADSNPGASNPRP